jgi:hypothetical protein
LKNKSLFLIYCYLIRLKIQLNIVKNCVTIMCCNDELSWLFSNRFSATKYMKMKILGKTEISANKTKISESFSKQPTQLIIAAHNCHTDSKITILNCISFPKTEKLSSKNGVKHIQTAGYNSAHIINLEYSVKVEISCRKQIQGSIFR